MSIICFFILFCRICRMCTDYPLVFFPPPPPRRQKMFPIFNELGLRLNPSCLYSLERDIYAIQENHKVEETGSRWTCNFCGKSFITEFYLDRHFENRHPDSIQVHFFVYSSFNPYVEKKLCLLVFYQKLIHLLGLFGIPMCVRLFVLST